MNELFLGLDLGTSSLKATIINKNCEIVFERSIAYNLSQPQPGFSEQNPLDWFDAVKVIIDEVSQNYGDTVLGMAIDGQMHGLVLLDENDEVIRPCILWNDSRSKQETEYLNKVVGVDKLISLTGNIAFAGFTLPKLLWVKNNEPQLYERIRKIMLPKDYLIYKLTGKFITDYSDASGTLYFDVEHKKWSKEILDLFNIDINYLPTPKDSFSEVGKLKPEFKLGKCIMFAGAGDNAAAAIGTGTINDGDCNISLGTSGTLFIASDKYIKVGKGELHSFAHSNGKHHLLGCILTAASARKWWLEEIVGDSDYIKDEIDISKVNTNVIFLPYLCGERSPHNDVDAKGAFINLTNSTSKGEMSLAIMEGVCFAVRDCVEIASLGGIKIKHATICGGGAKSRVWVQKMANILNIPISILQTEQGPSYGSAILAMVGLKYTTFEEAKTRFIAVKETLVPNHDDLLEEKYLKFKKLYRLLKELY